MSYATFEDIKKRYNGELSETTRPMYEVLLEDASVIVDAYNKDADEKDKKVVCCNMVIRRIGTDDVMGMPIGTTQGSMSALGYSQSFTMAGGSGELYLSRLDKKLLGVANKIGFASPWEV